MRGRHVLVGVWVAAGCSLNADYGGTEYRCDDGFCPAGQVCVAGVCRPPIQPAIDAAEADAPIDGGGADAPVDGPPIMPPIDAAIDARPCTEGDEAVVGPDGHCYSRWDNTVGRDTAIAACEALGGHLATLETLEVNTAVKAALITTDIALDAPYWLGLDDIVTEMTWVWIDGSPLLFTDWLPGEPNDSSGQDCGVIMVDSAAGAGWNDRGCSNDLGYLCER